MTKYTEQFQKSVKTLKEKGSTRIRTETGSIYEISENMKRVRRINSNSGMRRDREWLDVYEMGAIALGKPLVFILEPLGEGPYTIRTTSFVISIEN